MDGLGLTPTELAALKLSIQVATGCLVISLLPGIALGWLLARYTFWGKTLVETLVFLPLVLPPVVPGYLLLVSLGPRTEVGQWLTAHGIELAFNWKGAALASAVVGFPLLVQSVRLAISLVDRRLEQVASTLGASSRWIAWSITLPLALPGILTGAILSFGRSLGEFGATITFVGNIEGETQTLPLALYTLIQQPEGDQGAMRLVWLSLLLAFAALFASHAFGRWMTRRLGQGHHAGV